MEQIERSLLRSLLSLSLESCGHEQGCWRPAADVYREPGGWLCKFDLAGVAPEDLEVRASGRRLTVSGTRRDRTLTASREAFSMEIAYHRFERTLELPCEAEQFDIHCAMEHGMLVVELTERRG